MLHAFHAVDNNNNVQLFLKPRLHDTTRCLQPVSNWLNNRLNNRLHRVNGV